MKQIFLLLIMFLLFSRETFAQTITRTVSGTIYDSQTHDPLPFANVIVRGTDPVIGTASDADGQFKLENVPVGRWDFEVSMIGYERYLANELLVTTGKQIWFDIELIPTTTELKGVVVKVQKDHPLNSMATLSSRQFTVEETQRYAGGLNDPARLATSFAGVAAPSVSSNGISVRGNNPDGLLWLIEGVEVPNPNHFANLTVAGGGLLTSISNQMMAKSDFYTGAFPAEYGNASSGVFDIRLRTGNPGRREYTLQAGVIGVDFSTEGPFKKGRKASYLMNYRNSTMALVAPLLPENTGILKYQDLALKMNFPSRSAGTFSVWAIAAIDGQDMEADDSTEWKMDADRDNSETRLYMFAAGLSHKIRLGKNTFLNTKFSATGNGLSHNEKRVGYDFQEFPQSDITNNLWNYTIQSDLNHHFGTDCSLRSGIKVRRMGYDINIGKSMSEGQNLKTLSKGNGQSELFKFYVQSRIKINSRLTLNAGVNTQLFLLNNQFSIEPRIGLKYQLNARQSIALGYGLHSRIEQLPVYFVEIDGQLPNQDLGLMKSHHYVLAYSRKINDHLRLNVEPYYQYLTNVPVSPGSYVSSLNFEEEMFFDEALVNAGTGRNIGVDFTLEHFINKGFYYMFTLSLFDSKYKAADGVERNTRYNRNYVFNALAGKEWMVGRNRNKMISANIRLNYLGGIRKEPIDEEASLFTKDVIYGETTGNRAYKNRFDDQPIVSFTLSYRINKARHSSEWALKVLNLLSTEEFDTDFYNLKTHGIETQFSGIMIPNLSYKISF
jgi:hypothetical protein